MIVIVRVHNINNYDNLGKLMHDCVLNKEWRIANNNDERMEAGFLCR